MKVISDGVQLIFINDIKGVFYPVLSLVLDQAQFQNSSVIDKTFA
jgi:hypothetical protein